MGTLALMALCSAGKACMWHLAVLMAKRWQLSTCSWARDVGQRNRVRIDGWNGQDRGNNGETGLFGGYLIFSCLIEAGSQFFLAHWFCAETEKTLSIFRVILAAKRLSISRVNDARKIKIRFFNFA